MIAFTLVVSLPLQSIAIVCALAVVEIVDLLSSGRTLHWLQILLSTIINTFLELRYPVLDIAGKRTSIPSCPYVWPNGQGDTAKFLHGIENSRDWSKQYGDVYRIWSGMKPEIVLTRPHQLQEVFRDSDKHSKAPANNSGSYMNQLLGQCLGLISGRDWRAVRGAVEAPFQHNRVALQVENFQSLIEMHFADLNSQSESNLKNGLLHPVNDLETLPFRIIAEMVYGRLPPELAKSLEDLIPLRTRIFNEYVIRGGLNRFSWARFLPTAANAELARFKSSWKQFNRMALAYALQQTGPPPPIVAMHDALALGNLNEDQLLQTLDESLFANLDVTIGGLSWVPVFLAAHQDDQDRLRAEIDAARGDDNDAEEFNRYLRGGSSTFLSCCTLESSRLRPLAAFTVPQAAPTSRRIDIAPGLAYLIPAGTSFVVDTYALNVRNEMWAPDNEKFLPDRFLDNTGKDARARRYLFWRFGFGPRQCMGRFAADLMIRMIVSHLVRNYHLDLLPSEKGTVYDNWSRCQESWITHPDFRLRCMKRTWTESLRLTDI